MAEIVLVAQKRAGVKAASNFLPAWDGALGPLPDVHALAPAPADPLPGTRLLVLLGAETRSVVKPSARFIAAMELVEAGAEGALRCDALLTAGLVSLGDGNPRGGEGGGGGGGSGPEEGPEF
jgi:hypothetical protein